MMTTNDSQLHRLLDDAFAGIAATPDVQDLKEELRSSLVARVDELTAQGMPDAEAARRAIDELGDVRAAAEETAQAAAQAGKREKVDVVALALANKVKPKPAFVLRTVSLSAVIAIAAAVLVLAFTGVWDLAEGAMVAVGLIGIALPVGLIVVDSLGQETTSNYPMPRKRAGLYGLAVGAILAGAAFVTWFGFETDQLWAGILGVVVVVLGVLLATYVGVTQTNRHKPWTKAAAANYQFHNKWEEKPEEAARYGMYSGALWLLAIGAFVALSLTVGFAWSWIAFLVAVLVQMIMTARMLFGENKN